MKCRFCDDEAVAKYRMPGGCICFPDDREQVLCLHHTMRAQPRDGMYLVEDYTIEQVFAKGIWKP